MDPLSIKLEPGTSTEENAVVIFPEIDLDYSYIKKECVESISEINSGDLNTADHYNLKEVTIKAEPGTEEAEQSHLSYTVIDIEVPYIKKEPLEHSERHRQTAGATLRVKNIISVKQESDGKDPKKYKSFSCSECDRKLSSKASLMTHLRTHNKEKPYSCSYCSHACFQKSHLKRHIYTHTKEKPYFCSYCSFSCSDTSTLTKHIRTHTKEKPFSCTYCNSSFAQKSNLMRHVLTHTKQKPFSCSHCNFTCARKMYLTTHNRTHTKEKPFSCSYCSYLCSHKASLITHIRKHAE